LLTVQVGSKDLAQTAKLCNVSLQYHQQSDELTTSSCRSEPSHKWTVVSTFSISWLEFWKTPTD